jgi:catechol-2,3-dioxygenase
MAQPRIAELGHVGLHVRDLDVSKSFYCDLLGFTVTDHDPQRGSLFLSSRPDEEHHEIYLAANRNVPVDGLLLQQLSFRVNDIEELLAFHRLFREKNVEIDQIVTHGNAIGIYFFDPDHNRLEVYWDTGLEARQPFKVPVDLDREASDIIQEVKSLVDEFGATGLRR